MLMLYSGLRASEVASLTRDDVQIIEGRLFLKVRGGKRKRERIVPVTDEKVAEELLAFVQKKKKDERLFGVSAKTLQNYAYLIKKEIGVDFHCHMLRHAFIERLLAKGVGIDVVQKVLGLASSETRRIYAETLPEKIFELGAKVEETRREKPVQASSASPKIESPAKSTPVKQAQFSQSKPATPAMPVQKPKPASPKKEFWDKFWELIDELE